MKKTYLMVAAAMFLVMAAVPFAVSDTSDGAEIYYIEGYVVTHNPEGNSPLKDVRVDLLNGSTITSGTTDDSGKFSVQVDSNVNLMILFTYSGYSLVSCPNVTKKVGSEYYSLDLKNATFDGFNRYTITSEPLGLQCAVMGLSKATVVGTVGFNNGVVYGAQVLLVSINNHKYYATTDDKGYFRIDCPTGNYDLSVSCHGFRDSETMIVKVSDNMAPVNIILDKTAVKTFLGLDSVHLLMILGVIFGLTVTTMVVVISRHPDASDLLDTKVGDDD